MSELIDRGDVLGVISCFFEDSFIEDADVHCAELEREIDRLPTASPWHRVEDELPKLPDEDYCHVWCVGWFEGQTRSVPMEYGRILKRGKREERWLLYDRISLPPTKWAYLPDPPKEDA